MGSSVILPAPGQPKTGPDSTFKSAATPNIVTFGLQRVSPPSALYIQRDDVLSVYVQNSSPGLQVNVKGRMLLAPFPRVGQPDKTPSTDPTADPNASNNIVAFTQSFLPASTRAIQEFQIPLSEGYLLGLLISTPSPGLRKGQCYVQVFLGRTPIGGGVDLVPLISSYVASEYSPGWPLGPAMTSVDGAGVIRSIQATNPGAGADFTVTVPAGARWQLLGLNYQLVTSAAVATRTSQLVIDDGANVVFQNTQAAGQAASLTEQYCYTPLGGNSPVAQGASLLSLAPSAFLAAGYRIRSVTANIQAGDQYSLINPWVLEWLEL